VDEIVKKSVDECSQALLREYFILLRNKFTITTNIGVSSLGNIAYMLIKINDALFIFEWKLLSNLLLK
jgi:hypothetical protein